MSIRINQKSFLVKEDLNSSSYTLLETVQVPKEEQDKLVKVNSSDANAGYLFDKIKEGAGITIEVNTGADLTKKIEISANTSGFVVDVATTVNINLLQAPLVIDTFNLSLNDRILVKSQINSYENGIYLVSEIKGSNAILIRATDANSYNKFKTGSIIFVKNGNINENTLFFLISNLDPITWASNPKEFARITYTLIANSILYDNTTSGLTATNMQNAIDELNTSIENIDLTADNILYDNANSGLSSTNVQDVIDELNTSIENIEIIADNIPYDNTNSGLASTNVQDVIDELNVSIENINIPDISNIPYDNTNSGLSSTNMQNAIDELNVSIENVNFIAVNIPYDNTNSGLTTTNVQDVIDELNTSIENIVIPDISNIPYDNTTSGLLSTNIKNAIDELNTSIENIDIPDIIADNIPYDNATSGLTSTNVQDVIDELNVSIENINFIAVNIPYDNATSGLAATNMQNAIDELNTSIENIDIPEIPDISNIPYDNTISGLSSTNIKNAIDELNSLIENNDIPEIDITFNGNRPITRTSWPYNINPGGSTISEFLEKLFYPSISPIVSLSIQGGNIREFGATTAVTLNYTITKKTYAINNITIAGSSITVGPNIDQDSDTDGNQQTGTSSASATANVDTIFNISATDNHSSVTNGSTTLTWRHKRFWFIETTDLTVSSDSAITTYLNALSSGFELSTNRQQTRSLAPDNKYIYFVWPTSFGGTIDNFTINGLPNNGWIVKDFSYTNASGYIVSFRLFRSQFQLNASYSVVVN